MPKRNTRPTTNPAILRRLTQCMDLSPGEIADLRRLAAPVRQASPLDILVAEGSADGNAILLHEGWAIRHRNLRDGRRQILEFVVPGDLCEPSNFMAARADSAITAITAVTWTLVQPVALVDLVARSPRLGALLWWLEAQEGAMLRYHLVALGRLTARERLACLIWELWSRLRGVGLARDHTFELPATQDMLADATGLSTVHVSRTLNRLERDDIIQRQRQRWRILDPDRLAHLAQMEQAPGPRRLPRRVEDLFRR